MAWDSSRTVPWRRLTREWLVYVAVAVAAITLYSLARRRDLSVGLYAGLLASGPMYVLFGAFLAKFGYQRKTMKDLRAERAAGATGGSRPVTSGRRRSSVDASAAVGRARPAPTRRTSTGPSQHRKSTKPKRR